MAFAIHPNIEAAVVRWMRGEAPLTLADIAPLPVTLPDGRTVPFGDLSPDELHALADAKREQAERDFRAVNEELGLGDDDEEPEE
jgi:hypothetical protein